jgi:hypothetical protein
MINAAGSRLPSSFRHTTREIGSSTCQMFVLWLEKHLVATSQPRSGRRGRRFKSGPPGICPAQRPCDRVYLSGRRWFHAWLRNSSRRLLSRLRSSRRRRGAPLAGGACGNRAECHPSIRRCARPGHSRVDCNTPSLRSPAKQVSAPADTHPERQICVAVCAVRDRHVRHASGASKPRVRGHRRRGNRAEWDRWPIPAQAGWCCPVRRQQCSWALQASRR